MTSARARGTGTARTPARVIPVPASPDIRVCDLDVDEVQTSPIGSQTLLRGLRVLEAIADTPSILPKLAEHSGLTLSTAHRLASALVDRGYLVHTPSDGYRLGPKLLALGHRARQQLDISRVALPFMRGLAADTGDMVHLGVLSGDDVLVLAQFPGCRRVESTSDAGMCYPVVSMAVGKALILDMDEEAWRGLFERRYGRRGAWSRWVRAMRAHVRCGYAFNLEDKERRVRSVAAPVRDAGGNVVAAVGLSGAVQNIDDDRLFALALATRAAADGISRQLGWYQDIRAL